MVHYKQKLKKFTIKYFSRLQPNTLVFLCTEFRMAEASLDDMSRCGLFDLKDGEHSTVLLILK